MESQTICHRTARWASFCRVGLLTTWIFSWGSGTIVQATETSPPVAHQTSTADRREGVMPTPPDLSPPEFSPGVTIEFSPGQSPVSLVSSPSFSAQFLQPVLPQRAASGPIFSGSVQVDQSRITPESLNLSPAVVEGSPVLQRWLQQVPDVAETIAHDPSFRTRFRLGYSQFPSSDQSGGVNIGIQDAFVGQSGLTVSGEYTTAFDGQRVAWSADVNYYLQPLGNYVNFAPVVGYRYLKTSLYEMTGLNVGLRFIFVLSRGGGADLSLTQSWVAPGSDREIGLTTFSVGYALTPTLRLSTDIQQQNSRQRRDSRVGVVMEWML